MHDFLIPFTLTRLTRQDTVIEAWRRSHLYVDPGSHFIILDLEMLLGFRLDRTDILEC